MGGLDLTLAVLLIPIFLIWLTLWELVPTLKRIASALEESNEIKKGDNP